MKLKEYLDLLAISAIDFAKMCNLSPPVIYRILNDQKIYRKTAEKIKKKTKGKVIYKNIYIPPGSS
jgi:predicted transcriptional regulator